MVREEFEHEMPPIDDTDFYQARWVVYVAGRLALAITAVVENRDDPCLLFGQFASPRDRDTAVLQDGRCIKTADGRQG